MNDTTDPVQSLLDTVDDDALTAMVFKVLDHERARKAIDEWNDYKLQIGQAEYQQRRAEEIRAGWYNDAEPF